MLALVVILLAQGPVPNPAGPIFSSPSLMSNGAFFEFAPASGAGLPYAQDLCSYAQGAGLLAGSYWCTRGDGTALAGAPISVATASNSPVIVSQRICPNGPDCAAKSMISIQTTSSGYTEVANVDRSASVTTGAFTDCVHINYVNSGGTIGLMSLYSSTVGAFAHSIQILPSGVVRSNGANSACPGAPANVDGATALTPGAPAVICQTWAASDGIYRLYINGVADGVSSAFTTVCGGGSGSRYVVGGLWNAGAVSNAYQYGGILGAFHTESTTGNAGQLSAGQISTLTTALLARNPTGAKGEAPNAYSRAGAYFCESSTVGAGSIIPANVPCISQNGFGSFAQTVNLAQYYNALATAPWTLGTSGGPAPATLTANAAVGPTSVMDFTRLQVNACAPASSEDDVLQNYTGTAATWTGSCYLRGNGSSGNVSLFLFDSTAAAGTATNCAFANGVTSRCTVTRTFANTTHRLGVGCVNYAFISGSGNTGAADVLVWGCQSEVGAIATTVVPTTNASATKAADPGLSFTLASAVGPTMCMAGSVQFISTLVGVAGTISLGSSLGTEASHFRNTDTSIGFIINGSFPSTAVSSMGTSVHRAFLSDNAGTRTALWDTGAATAPSASMSSGQTAFRIGARWDASNPTNGWVSRVQVDPSPARCTP